MISTQSATKVATLWMDAMSKPGATQIKALSEVIAEDFCTESLKSKAEVLAWFGAWPGRSMFRTGTWSKPTSKGNAVTAICTFDAKAAYYRGVITLTVDKDGSIRHAAIDVRAAPEPLGGVIHRVWGPRTGLDCLPDHLAKTYGVTATKVTRLDNGVLRVDLAKGGPWVVRVFPSDRPFTDVKGDAAILRFLEDQDFPAERCLEDVSDFEGQGVLVTGFVEGKHADGSHGTWKKIAGLLGRLHALKGGPRVTKREVGGLHLYTADCTIRTEIDTALACMKAGSFRGTDKAWTALQSALAKADHFSSLPRGLSHPDFHVKNILSAGSSLIPIDWAGAGHAPRVLSLGMVLFYGSITPKGWNVKRVDEMVAAYSEHVQPTAAELDRLAEAMEHRMLIHETYSWCVGMATQRKPASRKDWPHNNQICEAIAARVREAF